MDKVKELECTHRGELRLRLVRHFPWVIPIYRFQTESEGGSSLAILAKDFKPLTLDWVLFYVGLLSLVLIEAGYYLPSESFPRFMLGALWFVIAVPFLISTLVVSIQSLFEKELWKSSEGAWYLCALIFPLLAASFGLGGVRWLMANNEGICQVSIARDCMGQDYSFGIYREGYLIGYPVRQFLLAYLPTLFFGHSLLMIRVGYFDFFLVGYTAFISGLSLLLRSYSCPRPWSIASAVSMCVAVSPWTMFTVRMYEQALTPICVTMLFLGGLMRYVERPTPYRLFWVAWALGFLPYVHRVSLSVIPMALLCLGVIFLHRKYRSPALIATMFYGVIAAIVGFLVVNNSVDGWKQILATNDVFLSVTARIARAFKELTLYSGASFSVVPPPLMFSILLVTYFSVRRWDPRFPVIILWSTGVLAATAILIGCGFHPVAEFDLFKTICTLPFLAAGVVIFYAENWPALGRLNEVCSLAARVTIVYMLFAGGEMPVLYRTALEGYEEYATDLSLEIQCLSDFVKEGHEVKKLYVMQPMDTSYLGSFMNYITPDMPYGREIPPNEKIKGYYVMYAENWKEGQPRPLRPIIKIRPE